MYIKEVKLCGFKSYKEDTVVPDLSDGLNIIVGRNGSGKSNIFSAIEFALTLEYNRSLKTDARQSLVYHGKKDGAFVEIVFDNTDRKLPTDSDVVTFRRVFSMKKDKFYVNNKELVNAKQFLDAAGFTNPYFIVKQGKIHDLALATDAARLKVVSDVTGVNAYDSKIVECRETLKAADSKNEDIKVKINELLERKTALEAEVAEQERFIKMDQDKRGIEFVLHQRKLQEIEKNLSSLEESRNKSSARQKPVREKLEKVATDMQIVKRNLNESEAKINQLQELKNEYEASVNKVAADIAYQNQELHYLKSKAESLSQERAAANAMDKEISINENILVETEKVLQQLQEKKELLYFQKCHLESRVGQFQEKSIAKGGKPKANAFGNQLSDLPEQRKELNRQIDEKQKKEAELLTETDLLQSLQKELSEFLSKYDEISHKVKEFLAEEQKIRSCMQVATQKNSGFEPRIAQKKERSVKLEDDWKKHVGEEAYHGWKGVRQILDDFSAADMHQNIREGYFGLVCEIIDCDPKLDIAVEISGGKKLVHHVVQSKRIAEVILEEFNARKCRGELNFLPIEDLKAKNIPQLPNLQGGAKSLASLIEIPDAFKSVSNFVFGSSVLCKSFEIATDIMREHKVQCVTLDGEKVSRVGVMTGGYRSRRPQKLEIQRAKHENEAELITLIDEKRKLDLEVKQLGQEYEELNKKLEKYRLQKSQLQENKRRLVSDIDTSEKKVIAYRDAIKTIDQNIVDIKANIGILEEKGKTPKRNGNASSEGTITAIKNFHGICAQYNEIEIQFQEKQKSRNVLDAKLKQMRKRYLAIVETSPQTTEVGSRSDVVRISEVIRTLSVQKKELDEKLDDVNRELLILQKEVSKHRKMVDNALEQESKLQETLGNICNELDTFATKHAQWLSRLAEEKEVGVNLGSVPANLEKYDRLQDRELYHKLKKLNTKLKDAVKDGINQKAIQQYEDLKQKCDSFQNRMESHLKFKEELEEFLADLCGKKGEAMLRNVRLIQEQFQKIFCTIVPKGKAELIFYGHDVSIDHDKTTDEIELMRAAGEYNFEGVRVSVNFVGKELHNIRGLAQLSGGQKSVIALCLILAIQSIDPAPFYLFDEVDQALDSAYRGAVARLLGEMSDRSQFICTTFRQELVDVADKLFGVSFDNRCSHIRPITEEQALNFVENDYTPINSGSISPNGSYSHSSSAA